MERRGLTSHRAQSSAEVTCASANALELCVAHAWCHESLKGSQPLELGTRSATARTSPTTTCRTGSSPPPHVWLLPVHPSTRDPSQGRRANRLVTYVNGVHPLAMARSTCSCPTRRVVATLPATRSLLPSPDPLVLRTEHDLAAPVLVLESEFDTLRSWGAVGNPTRFPSAGGKLAGSHGPPRVRPSAHMHETVLCVSLTKGWAAAIARGNHFSISVCAKVRHGTPARLGAPRRPAPHSRYLLEWSGGRGRPRPPRQRPGGIRLPHLALPTAQYLPRLSTPGLRQAFPARGTGPALHGSRHHGPRFDAATRDAVGSGFLPNRMPSRRPPSQPRPTNNGRGSGRRSRSTPDRTHAPSSESR